MMCEEVLGNDSSSDKVVIHCVHHKTGTTGLAFFVITKHYYYGIGNVRVNLVATLICNVQVSYT